MSKKHKLAILLVIILSALSRVAHNAGNEQLCLTLSGCMVVVCIWGLKDLYDNFIKY